MEAAGQVYDVTIEAPADQLGAIHRWLTEVDELRGRVEPRREPPAPGTMGASLALLTVALGSGGSGVALARALCTWLVQRRSDISIRVTAADGQAVELDVVRARDPELVLRQFEALLRRQDAQAGSEGE